MPVPALELVDETFVVARPVELGRLVHDPRRWREWWPDLVLTTFMDRGDLGIRWSAAGARWTGSVEIWLEAVAGGVLLHHYQRLDPTRATVLTARELRRARADRARSWKTHAFAVKDALEGDRRPGDAATAWDSDGVKPAN